MELSIEGQLVSALISIGGGFIAGLVYDILGAVRRRFKSDAVAALFDALYWLICAVMLFALGLSAGHGKQRVFMMVLAALGAMLYGILLHGIFTRFMDFFASGVCYLLGAMVLPAKFFAEYFRKFTFFSKKVFSSLKKRYKIKLRSKVSSGANTRLGEDELEIQTHRYIYEADNSVSAGLRSNEPRHPTGQDSRRRKAAGRAGAAGRRHNR